MDIEHSEWEAFAAILSQNILPRVKHLGFETHTEEMLKNIRSKTTTGIYAGYMDILIEIENLGFRKFSTHYNKYGIYNSVRTGIDRTCCMELVYVNLNFLRPGYEESLL